MLKISAPLLAVAALSAHAEFAMDFRAKDIRNDGSWPAVSGGYTMSPVHSSNGWTNAGVNKSVKPFGAVSFETTSEGTPSPFAFDRHTATQGVSHAFVIVYADSQPAPMATLINAPSVPLMLEPDSGNALFDTPPVSRDFVTEFYGGASLVELDGCAQPLFSPSPKARLIHCHWETPQPLNRLFVGNSPANPQWQMEWTGTGIAEIILAGDLGESQVNAVKRYFSAVFGIRDISRPDPEIPSILRKLGLDNSVFGTITIVR